MGGASLFRVGDAVEFWRVLTHLSILVVFVIALERGLHALERRLKRSPKYKEMLSKAYRELMILGLVGLAIKICKEVMVVEAHNASFVAFNVADLTIFILALALILQAMCVFLRLRRHNRRISRAELIRTTDLVDALVAHKDARTSLSLCARLAAYVRLRSDARDNDQSKPRALSHSWQHCAEVVELRVLRHIFLRRYGLPELFPFSKYIRQAQDSQITHMIDVEISTWVLLLVVAWGLEATVTSLVRVRADRESQAFVTVFLVFAWALVALHVAVTSYFDHCLRQLLHSAGYSTSHTDMLACLQRIAQEEADSWRSELAADALDTMEQVQEREDAKQLKRKRKRHHVVESDTGFQLIATCFRHARRRMYLMRVPSNRDEYATSVETPSSDVDRPMQLHRQNSLAPVELRWFSRKAWHFIVMSLLVLNGFYLALLLQCIMYRLGTVFYDFGWFTTLLIPLPLVFNTLVLQPRIFRSFMIVCSIFRVHVEVLTHVITHFREVVKLRTEFVSSLSDHMCERSRTAADLQRKLEVRDPHNTGMIEVEKLRLVLRSFGLQLSHSHFNSVAKLLFKIKGSQMEYAQVLRLLSVLNENSGMGGSAASAPIHPLQHQLVLTEDGCLPATKTYDAAPAVASVREITSGSRREQLTRNDSQLLGASSRAIRCLFHIESMEFDATSDASSATHYVRL